MLFERYESIILYQVFAEQTMGSFENGISFIVKFVGINKQPFKSHTP